MDGRSFQVTAQFTAENEHKLSPYNPICLNTAHNVVSNILWHLATLFSDIFRLVIYCVSVGLWSRDHAFACISDLHIVNSDRLYNYSRRVWHKLCVKSKLPEISPCIHCHRNRNQTAMKNLSTSDDNIISKKLLPVTFHIAWFAKFNI